jgi:glyoxylase-like metal-dependent hydrolase (beta-lactamase superfamily II)
LAAIGVAPAQIDVVVLSHLHFDHAGGALTAYQEGAAPALVFPRATWVVGEEAWTRATAPHARDRASFIPELQPLLEATGRLERVKGATSDVLGAGYRFHRSEGHTPGLLLAEVDMPAGPVVFAADLIPGKPWVHVPITMGYDRYPEKLIDEKTALLGELVGRHGRLFFTHDPTIAVGAVTRDAKGRYSTTDDRAAVRELAN